MTEKSTTSGAASTSRAARGTLSSGNAAAVVRRRIHAAPAEVFAAWLDADGMRQWMCPGPVQESRATLDARVGGRFRIDMVAGTAVIACEGEYLELDPPRRLCFIWISPATNGERTVVTIDLTEQGGATDFVLTHERLASEDAARRHTEGWGQIADKLAAIIRT